MLVHVRRSSTDVEQRHVTMQPVTHNASSVRRRTKLLCFAFGCRASLKNHPFLSDPQNIGAVSGLLSKFY